MAARSAVSLKLMIDKKANKVIFGEANKDLVDFLFSIMSLPLGTVITLLSKQNMVGCLGELYGSIEKLNETYIQPHINKDSILQTKSVQVPLLISNNRPTTTSNTIISNLYQLCNVCQKNIITCRCGAGTSIGNAKGYVQGVATYMVMDDLAVMPMSTISSIELLNQFNVHDVRSLEQKVVNLGMKEGLMLLKASLQSKTVLTDSFLAPIKEEI